MEYSAIFSATEKALLKSLIGKTIDSVQIPGLVFSVRLLSGEEILDFVPEEFSIPEIGNPLTDVTRPVVSNDVSRIKFDETKIIAQDLGVVKSLQILHTNIFFSSREPVKEPTVIADVEIPVTYGWNSNLMHPRYSGLDAIRQHPEKILVSLDVGIFIETSNKRSLYIYSDGCSYFVYGDIDSSFPKELEGKVEFLPLGL